MIRTTSVADLTFSLRRMLLRWLRTVWMLEPSSVEIALVVFPSFIFPATSRSRGVKEWIRSEANCCGRG